MRFVLAWDLRGLSWMSCGLSAIASAATSSGGCYKSTEQEAAAGPRLAQVELYADLPLCHLSKRGAVYFIRSSDSFVYCDGLHYQPLELRGLDGASALVLSRAAVEQQCRQGGFVLEAGVDQNANGALESSEIKLSELLCNGINGSSCSASALADGRTSIMCTDGTEATLRPGMDGRDGVDGRSCRSSVDDAGVIAIECPDSPVVYPNDFDRDGVVDVLDRCPRDNPDDANGDGICDSDVNSGGWTWQFGGTMFEDAEALAVDSQGAVLVGGRQQGSMFVAKLSSAGGGLQWMQKVSSQSGTDDLWSLSVDAKGDVYLGGDTLGDLDGDGHAGGTHVFFGKLSGADGRVLWLNEPFDGSAAGDAGHVAVDAQGNLLTTGVTYRDLDGEPNTAGSNAFVAKLSGEDGGIIWVVEPFDDADALSEGRSIAVDSHGDALIAGSYHESSAPPWTGGDALVAKLSGKDGALFWMQRTASDAQDSAAAVAVDSRGDVLVAGATEGALDSANNAGGYDVFVEKLSGADGSLSWLTQLGSNVRDVASSISLGAGSTVWVTGITDGILSAQGSAGGMDGFVLQLSESDGRIDRVRQMGTDRNDQIFAIVAADSDTAFVAGSTEGDVGGHGNGGGSDAFAARIATPPP